jgi:cold shock CspA family protein
MTGKIARIMLEKGFGFIAGQDGSDYFFHRSAVTGGTLFEQLRDGLAVTLSTSARGQGRALKASALRANSAGREVGDPRGR